MEELKKFKIDDLYKKFKKEKIDINILWKLGSQQLDYLGLSPIEKLRYQEAQKLRQSGNVTDAITAPSPSHHTVLSSGNLKSYYKYLIE